MNDRILRRAARFHGHLGPWLVLGLRAGSYARRRLGADPFHLTALVNCPARPPYRCFLDGVQLGSGCTLGKGNIRLRVDRRRCWVVFTATKRGRIQKMSLVLLPGVWAELTSALNAESSGRSLIRLARAISRRPFPSLFSCRIR